MDATVLARPMILVSIPCRKRTPNTFSEVIYIKDGLPPPSLAWQIHLWYSSTYHHQRHYLATLELAHHQHRLRCVNHLILFLHNRNNLFRFQISNIGELKGMSTCIVKIADNNIQEVQQIRLSVWLFKQSDSTFWCYFMVWLPGGTWTFTCPEGSVK